MADATRGKLIETHYDVLGVAETASEAEIVDAEIALRKVHEARSKQGDAAATDLLRRLNEANAELTSRPRRLAYNRQPRTVALGFRDVAHSPSIDRFDKLAEIAAWLGGDDPVRAATLLDVRPLPEDLLASDDALDRDG